MKSVQTDSTIPIGCYSQRMSLQAPPNVKFASMESCQNSNSSPFSSGFLRFHRSPLSKGRDFEAIKFK